MLAPAGKLLAGDRVAQRMSFHRAQGHRIVFTNGCFDILHRGHTTYLNRAKALGDVLVVGVNTDAGVRRLKGDGRPINRLEDRIEVLAALSCVDHVVAGHYHPEHVITHRVRFEDAHEAIGDPTIRVAFVRDGIE